MIVVSDTTPLIGLASIQRFELLREIFGELIIAQAVYDEAVVGFHGQSIAELHAAFEEAVDDYIETCERFDLSPQQWASDQAASDGLLPEYDLDFSKARPNRFAGKIDKSQVVVMLEPDIAEVFTTPGRSTPSCAP